MSVGKKTADRRASKSPIIAVRLEAAAWDLVRDSGEARHFAATIRRFFSDRLMKVRRVRRPHGRSDCSLRRPSILNLLIAGRSVVHLKKAGKRPYQKVAHCCLGPTKLARRLIEPGSKVEITLGRPAAVLEQSRSTRASRPFEWRTGASKSAWDFANLLTVGWYGRFKVERAFCAFRCNSDESVRPNFGQRWKSSRSRLGSPSEFRNYPPRGTPIGKWDGSLVIGGNQGVLWNPYGRNE
ncbi:unnamed protein product [Bursaphelenchus xylophilus]|uniref:(pine wood nematode) hypothetical protein n=1 Tax=Bursaphelenchus xylophilus TaxID=6326 RepID=A0A1I7RIN5_BURXY|nr:unnamed protein product [Bursaphelenchus xylophilus]CAG9118952.1 unnamed protein product [Bursaphelenchus xylophilus]